MYIIIIEKKSNVQYLQQNNNKITRESESESESEPTTKNDSISNLCI
jgi:hypothetical protein